MRKRSSLKWFIVGILVVFALFHLVTLYYTSTYEVKEEYTTNTTNNSSNSDMSGNRPPGLYDFVQGEPIRITS